MLIQISCRGYLSGQDKESLRHFRALCFNSTLYNKEELNTLPRPFLSSSHTLDLIQSYIFQDLGHFFLPYWCDKFLTGHTFLYTSGASYIWTSLLQCGLFNLPQPFGPMRPYLHPTLRLRFVSTSISAPWKVMERFIMWTSLLSGCDASTPVTALFFACRSNSSNSRAIPFTASWSSPLTVKEIVVEYNT